MAIGFGCFSLFGDLEKVGREGVEMEMPNMRKKLPNAKFKGVATVLLLSSVFLRNSDEVRGF